MGHAIDLVEPEGDVAWAFQPGRRWASWLLVVYGPMFLWLCLPITGLGGWSTRGIEVFALFPIVGLVQVLVAMPLLLAAATRAHGRQLCRNGALLGVGFVALAWTGDRVRMHAFHLAGERAAPLVAAIERYVAANGVPPASLSILVPRWIARLPDGLPPLRLAGDARNSWSLTASVPSGLVNFDRFVYLPNQDYPEHDTGGSWQRLGRWAYFHE